MYNFLMITAAVFPTMLTVVITSIRVERRLTKIETDLSWVTSFIKGNGFGCAKAAETECEK